MPRIFISYKRVDKEKVFMIKDQIESAIGEKCWIDLDGIESDAQFVNVIINAIDECEVVLFMYSKAHTSIIRYDDDWTIRELSYANAKGKKIVIINLDDTPLSECKWFQFMFELKQQVTLSVDTAVCKLFEDLRNWLHIENGELNHHTSRWAIPNKIFFRWVKSELDKGLMVTFCAKGKGMMPTISDNDGLTIQKPNTIRLYDIVLAEVNPDDYVLLRVIKISGEDITLMGDAKFSTEKCKSKDIIAHAISLFVNEQEYQLGSSKERRWAKKWTKSIIERDSLLRTVTQEQLLGNILPLKAR